MLFYCDLIGITLAEEDYQQILEDAEALGIIVIKAEGASKVATASRPPRERKADLDRMVRKGEISQSATQPGDRIPTPVC